MTRSAPHPALPSLGLALALTLLAPLGVARAIPLSGEAMVGVGLDYGGFGDYDHYLVLEPAGAVDGRVRWFSFGLRGSLALDAVRFHNQDFAWDVAGGPPGTVFFLAAPLGYESDRLRVRLGPWLRSDSRGFFGRRTSFFPWGSGDLRIRLRRVHLLVEAFSHLPVATSGSGLHLGVHLPEGYGRASTATWTLYISSPLLIGIASRHQLGQLGGHPTFVQLSAGFDLWQGWRTSKGAAVELGAALGWMIKP
jgi:hypothetical protein